VVVLVLDRVPDLAPVEAAMLVEPRVLGGHDGSLKVWRDAVQRHERVALLVALPYGLHPALGLHRSGRGIEPTQRDERQSRDHP
jgi:hypothetical protein